MKKINTLKVLIACEESQRVCMEFRKLGHEAYSCDIQEPSGGHPEWHIHANVLPLLDGRCTFTTMDGEENTLLDRWDLIIAHPPCTYLSNAGACRLYPRKGCIDLDRYEKGLEARLFFMRFLEADCDRICVENPMPSKIFAMPQETQRIQPYDFYGSAHPYTKKTYLWLKGLPRLIPIEPAQPVGSWCPSGTGRKRRETYGAAKRGNDAAERAKTFPGIARAMAEQWSEYILTEE